MRIGLGACAGRTRHRHPASSPAAIVSLPDLVLSPEKKLAQALNCSAGAGIQLLGDAGLAEELVQECFVRLWRTAGRFDTSRGTVAAYLFVMARSIAADLRKRPSSRPLSPVEDAQLPVVGNPPSVMARPPIATSATPCSGHVFAGGRLRAPLWNSARTSVILGNLCATLYDNPGQFPVKIARACVSVGPQS